MCGCECILSIHAFWLIYIHTHVIGLRASRAYTAHMFTGRRARCDGDVYGLRTFYMDVAVAMSSLFVDLFPVQIASAGGVPWAHTPQARWLFLSCNYFKCKKYMWFFFLFKRFKIIKLSIMVLPITDISQIAIIMTSPTSLGADAKAQTPNKKQQQHAVPSSNVAVPSAASSTEEGTSMLPPPETPQFRSCGLFSWMKVFRYADLMLRQGC